jgi:hypothetical protein
MKSLKLFLLLSFIGLHNACSWANNDQSNSQTIIFVGCTPADDLIKSQLGISAETKTEFIRWELKLQPANTFTLHIKFGESKPNTLGFKAGGHSKDYQGTYTTYKNNNNEYYHLEANPLKISMIRLNDNLFHLLTPQNQLMVGNGGWSYTLNNKNPLKDGNDLPQLTNFNHSTNDKLVQVIYDGRTPCQDFAAEHQMKVSQSCFKLKWKLILNRDSVNYAPTTYQFRKVVDNIPQDITGTWTIIKGIQSNPDAVVYQLDPDKPKESFFLLVAGENILFFLHQDKSLFVGNENFSFTLNKRHN